MYLQTLQGGTVLLYDVDLNLLSAASGTAGVIPSTSYKYYDTWCSSFRENGGSGTGELCTWYCLVGWKICTQALTPT